MSRTSTIVSSTSILGMGLTVVLDLIEPYLGGFRIAAICSLIVLALGLIVWALPPLNNYLLSAARGPDFRDLINRFWPKPFFISNTLLLVILLTMLQLSNKYDESGGFTRTALSSLHVIEGDVKEIRKISTEHLEVSKQVAETSDQQLEVSKEVARIAAFNQRNTVYYSMQQYIKNGYSISELDSGYPEYSADIASNLINLLAQAFTVYEAEDQVGLLQYFKDKGYFKQGQTYNVKRGGYPMLELNMELPADLTLRAETLGKRLREVSFLEPRFHQALIDINDYEKILEDIRKDFSRYPEEANDYRRKYLDKITSLEEFLSHKDELSGVFDAIAKLPRAARLGVNSLQLSKAPVITIEIDPLALARIKGTPAAIKWLDKHTSFTGDKITSIDMWNARAVYVLPDWRLANIDEYFWTKMTSLVEPDIKQLNKLETDLLALDLSKIAASYPSSF